MSELQNKVEIHMEHIGMVYPADGKEVTALTDVTLDIQKGDKKGIYTKGWLRIHRCRLFTDRVKNTCTYVR